MLLTVSPNINNTLCYVICWHVFVGNVITSYMQNYCIRYIILYNRVDVSFHLLESSSYKRAKSAIAFLQTGIKFIFSYANLPYLYLAHMLSDQNELLHCTWFTKIFIHSFIHSFIHPGIRFLLYLEIPSVSLSRNWFLTGVGVLWRVVTLLSILLLNAFLYLLTSLFILLLMWGSVTSFSWIKKAWCLLLTSIELDLLLLTCYWNYCCGLF